MPAAGRGGGVARVEAPLGGEDTLAHHLHRHGTPGRQHVAVDVQAQPAPVSSAVTTTASGAMPRTSAPAAASNVARRSRPPSSPAAGRCTTSENRPAPLTRPQRASAPLVTDTPATPGGRQVSDPRPALSSPRSVGSGQPITRRKPASHRADPAAVAARAAVSPSSRRSATQPATPSPARSRVSRIQPRTTSSGAGGPAARRGPVVLLQPGVERRPGHRARGGGGRPPREPPAQLTLPAEAGRAPGRAQRRHPADVDPSRRHRRGGQDRSHLARHPSPQPVGRPHRVPPGHGGRPAWPRHAGTLVARQVAPAGQSPRTGQWAQ